MKSLKAVVLSLVFIFLVIVVVQNRNIFMEEKIIRLNLWVWNDQTPAIPLAVYFLGFFLIGLLISYFCGLSERFKAKKTIGNHVETIRKLEEEVKALKTQPASEPLAPPKESESA